MRTFFRKALPKPALGALLPAWRQAWNVKYSWNLKHHHIIRNRILVLGTIPKSGLHFTQFFFANYLRLLNGTSHGPVTPDEMFKMFPNHWHRAYFAVGNYQTPTPELKSLGLDDLPFEHMAYQSPYWHHSKVLHLYRNPLDYAVSWFYHAYEYRPSRAGIVSGPVETLDKYLDYYATLYISYRKREKAENSNVMRLSYEDLVTNPEPCFTKILSWLGADVEPSLVERAARYSSKEIIMQFEERDGHISQIEEYTGRFVRNGDIGQWKNHFNKSDLDSVRLKLGRYGIDLDEFTLEP